MLRPEDAEARVLVYAPIGRDGSAGARLLQRAGFSTYVCKDAEDLLMQAETGALTACITEEGLFGKNLDLVSEWLKAQPAWSGLPFVVLTGKSQSGSVVRWRKKMTELLGNVSLLERPTQSLALTTMVQTAARARMRQYEIRSLLLAEKQ
ncbi:MAG: hybrid sensor histidine kinase/response regulator, partial [Achromobacter mucicolens]